MSNRKAPVTTVGWEVRRGEKYFSVLGRADGTVEKKLLRPNNLLGAERFLAKYFPKIDEQRKP